MNAATFTPGAYARSFSADVSSSAFLGYSPASSLPGSTQYVFAFGLSALAASVILSVSRSFEGLDAIYPRRAVEGTLVRPAERA